jgi:hypothetical protein
MFTIETAEVFYSPDKDQFFATPEAAAIDSAPGNRIVRFKRAGDAEVIQTVMFGMKRGRKAKKVVDEQPSL